MSNWNLSPLIQLTPKGLYCAAGDFYIDPSRAVETAIVTHAHSDHARRGSRKYLCHEASVGLLKARLGHSIQVEGIPYRHKIRLGEVDVSLHSAGHILGSAQVRVEFRGQVWVASGDYKREPDPSCDPFEPVICDTFITEATFGTPKYVWENSQNHGQQIHHWWKTNAAQGFNSLLYGYSLGKAQRILAELAPHAHRPIYIHDTIAEPTRCYREQGVKLAPTQLMSAQEGELFTEAKPLSGELFLAPPSILKTDWVKRLGKFKTAFASGWMQGSSFVHQDSYDYGFIMSDHADWRALNQTIKETHATRVFVQHRNGALVRHLRKQGIEAYPEELLQTESYCRIEPVNLSLL